MATLVDLARELCAGADATAKPLNFYAIYDRYFAEYKARSLTFLELGVHTAESLKVWSSYFPNGTVIGIDLAKASPDFSAYPNAVYESADQGDSERLKAICEIDAPEGFDIIIDDASHIGHLCATSYTVLFPLLKSGGLYIIEDWGTGYYDDWPDGGHYQKIRIEPFDGLVPKRLPSHDFGMVGFVKALVDEVAGDHIRPTLRSRPTRTDTIEFMHIYKTFAIIKKLLTCLSRIIFLPKSTELPCKHLSRYLVVTHATAAAHDSLLPSPAAKFSRCMTKSYGLLSSVMLI